MSKHDAPDERTLPAANDICEFAMLAFESQWLRWNKTWNLNLAQLAWNAGNPTEQPIEMFNAFSDPMMETCLQHLLDVRRKRFRDREFCVFDLDLRIVRGEMVFTFVLSWNGGEETRPCEMTVDNASFGDAPLFVAPPPALPLVTDLGQLHSIVIPRLPAG